MTCSSSGSSSKNLGAIAAVEKFLFLEVLSMKTSGNFVLLNVVLEVLDVELSGVILDLNFVLCFVEVVLFRVVVDVIELDVSEEVVGFSDELVIKVDIVLKHLFPPEKFSSVVIVVIKAKQS